MLEFITTADGSKTLYNAEIGENYHSKHGALQESRHVFLDAGMRHYVESTNTGQLRILEVGFGTGLNFLLSAAWASENKISLDYTGIEAYPLAGEMIGQTGYGAYVPERIWAGFRDSYARSMLGKARIDAFVQLHIAGCRLLDFRSEEQYDLVYFDAFASLKQPEMWTGEALAHINTFLKPGGIFVTYAITGNLKRSMKAMGFSIEKAPGAAGKREMLRATKMHAHC